MALNNFGPFLNDEDIASMLDYLQIEQHAQLPDTIPHQPPLPCSPSSSPSRSPLPRDCPICLTRIHPTHQFQPASCAHIFCTDCIKQYLTTIAKETRKFPILCPSCTTSVDTEKCLAFIKQLPEIHNLLDNLILEKTHIKHIAYCAVSTCAVPFEFLLNPAVQGSPDEFKVLCPYCNKLTCVKCKVEWHISQTCAQYNAESSQSGLLKLAKEQHWRSCPGCHNLIERRLGDCYYVQCRCGCGFCHKCGLEYKDGSPTDRNTHGTPACSCGLFEDVEQPRQPPPLMQPPMQPPYQGPYQVPPQRQPVPPRPQQIQPPQVFPQYPPLRRLSPQEEMNSSAFGAVPVANQREQNNAGCANCCEVQ